MKTIIIVGLCWLGIALIIAWVWSRVRGYEKSVEEMSQPKETGKKD